MTRQRLAARGATRLVRSASPRTAATRENALLRLQRTRGNRFVQRLLNRDLLQRQPTPNDSGPITLELGEVEIACIFATETPILDVDTHVLFAQDSAALTPIAVADIENFIVRWHAGGADQMVRIDAYASSDGPEPYNRSLSCDRAYAVKKRLQLPAHGCPGIPSDFISPYAHGETIAFSNTLAPNRRATITADIPSGTSFNPATVCP